MALKIAVLGMCSGHTSDLTCVKFVVKPPVNYWPVLGGGETLPEKKRRKFWFFFGEGAASA